MPQNVLSFGMACFILWRNSVLNVKVVVTYVVPVRWYWRSSASCCFLSSAGSSASTDRRDSASAFACSEPLRCRIFIFGLKSGVGDERQEVVYHERSFFKITILLRLHVVNISSDNRSSSIRTLEMLKTPGKHG